jgi:hypothetical protein
MISMPACDLRPCLPPPQRSQSLQARDATCEFSPIDPAQLLVPQYFGRKPKRLKILPGFKWIWNR